MRHSRRRRRRARRNPTGLGLAIALGGGGLAAFGAYKAYNQFQNAGDASEKASGANVAGNRDALAQWTAAESDYKTAAWTWSGVSLVGGVIAALSLWK